MGREKVPQGMFDLAEENMRHLGRASRVNEGAGNVAADDFQRVANAFGAARVLHRAGVGQVLCLTADRGLDKPRHQPANPAEQPQREAKQRHRRRALIVARAAPGAHAIAAAQQHVADIADKGNALEHGDQAYVQTHVVPEDMAELVRNHAL